MKLSKDDLVAIKRDIVSATKDFKEAYKTADVDACEKSLMSLIVSRSFDTELEKRGWLKRQLFKTDCVKNPLSYRFSEEDYNITVKVFGETFEVLNKLKNVMTEAEKVDITDIIDDDVLIDLLDIIFYTKIMYKMSMNNNAWIDTSTVVTKPFAEQLMTILLFFQDQARLMSDQSLALIKDGFFTGMEPVVSNQSPAYYDGFNVSIADSVEADIESINELVLYLYFRNKNTFPDRIDVTALDYSLIHPYENADFERLKCVAHQSSMLHRLEEGIRYGYLHIDGTFESGDARKKGFLFGITNEERYKAHYYGIFRRQAQVRSDAAINFTAQKTVEEARKVVSRLASQLIKKQKDGFVLFELGFFNPDTDDFIASEKITSIQLDLIEHYTRKYFLEVEYKGTKVRDLIATYTYLYTLSEIVEFAAQKLIKPNDHLSLIKQLSIVDISYLESELSRIHGLPISQSQQLIDAFILRPNAKNQDVFSNPLVMISGEQVILGQALWDQVNMDRVIERFLPQKAMRNIGKAFEKQFIQSLLDGYATSLSNKRKPIPGLKVNTNEIKFKAYDGREVEFDCIAVLKNCLLLIELKAVLKPYSLDSLESKRKDRIEDAKEQLLRRREIVQHDWDKIRELVSFEMPEKPYDRDHIVMIACTDIYDFTPLYEDEVFITDDSTLLKYFTNPFIEGYYGTPGNVVSKTVAYLWKGNEPRVNEFKSYLRMPNTVKMYRDVMKKEWMPIYNMDEKDVPMYCEEYRLTEDPVKKIMRIKE